MERKIKFRGKSINQNMWLYGHLFQWGLTKGVLCVCCCVPNSYRDVYNIYAVNPETIGQYTGMKDKNGREIYEGDIISNEDFVLGYIVFSMRYGISIQRKNTSWSLRNFCFDSDLDVGILDNMEVVGNIHDNPELIK